MKEGDGVIIQYNHNINMSMVCQKCIMDDVADEYISFNKDGVCNYWEKAMYDKAHEYFPNQEGKKKLENLVDEIRKKGENRPYDCIIGLSGGLDSSYLAYICHQYNLRMLGVHLNDGFDEQVSTENVKKLANAFDIDLIEINPDPEIYNSLIRAYLMAGVPNLAAPQDNIITSALLKIAKKYKIKYFMSGVNFSLECILQKGNTITNRDKRNILDIYRRFGEGKSIRSLGMDSPLKRDIYYKVEGITTCCLLNYIDYNMQNAINTLSDACGFSYYGGKHYENYFTRFVQQIWLVDKFGVDKRKSHYSSLIASDQMTREEALECIRKPVITEEEKTNLIERMSKKIGVLPEEIERMLRQPGVQHTKYKTSIYLKIKKVIKDIL